VFVVMVVLRVESEPEWMGLLVAELPERMLLWVVVSVWDLLESELWSVGR
jgi:hypothetical protein